MSPECAVRQEHTQCGVLHEASQECWIQWVSKMDDNGEDSQGCCFMKTVRSTSSQVDVDTHPDECQEATSW